jgi:hypothetical protein
MTMLDPLARGLAGRMATLDIYITEGRLIRGAWTGTDAQGRETACLLAALYPETGKQKSVDACPAGTIPAWWAHATIWIDDAGTLAHWPDVVRRYAALSLRWHALDARGWERVSLHMRRASLVEAKRHTDNARALAVCDAVLALITRGDKPMPKEWAEAEAAEAEAAAAGAAAAGAATWAEAAAEEASQAAGVWAVDPIALLRELIETRVA